MDLDGTATIRSGARRAIAVPLYAAVYTLGALLIGVTTRFGVPLNDFWGNWLLAEFLDGRDPASFYNGFFPIGYTLFLRLLGALGDARVGAWIANALFGGLLLLVIGGLATRMVGRRWGWVAVVAASLHPLLFGYVLTPGPDIGCVTFAAWGGWLALADDRRVASAGRLLASGALLGLAALWRYHGLVWAVALTGAVTVVGVERRGRRCGLMALGFLAVFAVQVGVNLWSGHGPLATSQSFNVYKLMYGVDWWHVPRDLPTSIAAVIRHDPCQFLLTYLNALSESWWLLAPPVIGALLIRARRPARLCLTLVLAFLAYLAVVVMGGSVRGYLPVVPFFVLSLVVLARWSVRAVVRRRAAPASLKTLAVAGGLVFAGLFALGWLVRDARQIGTALAHRQARDALEEALVKQEGVTQARQVFTDSFDLYLPSLRPPVPYTHGGWVRYDLRGFSRRYPELDLTSLDAFLADCARHGVTHLALSPQAAGLMPALGGFLAAPTSDPRLRHVGTVAGFQIFRVGRP